jgi:hypothetical protein
MHPAVSLRPVEVEQQTREVERGIALEIKQDVDQFIFDACQSRLAATAHRPLSRLLATTGNGRFSQGLSKRGLQRCERLKIQACQRPQQSVIPFDTL